MSDDEYNLMCYNYYLPLQFSSALEITSFEAMFEIYITVLNRDTKIRRVHVCKLNGLGILAMIFFFNNK